MKICLAGDCQNKHHSLYNMYMYICIHILSLIINYIYYKYHNLILNILIINDNNLLWLLALLLLLCLLLTLVLFLLLMTNTSTLAMIKIIDTQKSKNTINSSHHIHAKSTSQSVLIDVRVVVSEYSLTCIVLEEYVGLPACTTAGGAQHQKQPEFIASYPAPLSSSKHAACPQDYEAALDYLSTVATVSTVLSGGILPEWTSSIFQLNSSLLFWQHFGGQHQQAAHTCGCISAKVTPNKSIVSSCQLTSSCTFFGRCRPWAMALDEKLKLHQVAMKYTYRSLRRTLAQGCP